MTDSDTLVEFFESGRKVAHISIAELGTLTRRQWHTFWEYQEKIMGRTWRLKRLRPLTSQRPVFGFKNAFTSWEDFRKFLGDALIGK